jgi:hypothetical protein
MAGILQILNHEIVWDIETPKTEEGETPKLVVN